MFVVAAFAVLAAAEPGRSQTITTVAGGGTGGDEGPAITAGFIATGIAVDSGATLYIADRSNSRIRKVDTNGIIHAAAGNGTPGFSGDGGPATNAQFLPGLGVFVQGVATDSQGSLYIADGGNNRVRKVDGAGVINTVAGNGLPLFSGDGGPAVNAQLFIPSALAVDRSDNLYILDSQNNRIRKVDTAGVITTVAGNGGLGFSGDGGPATAASFNGAVAIAADGDGNLYIVDRGNSRVRKVNAAGTITTIAGSGTPGFGGDGGPATNAQLFGPVGIAVDRTGNVYIGDSGNNRIRKVDAAGVITTIAGTGLPRYSGDGGPAVSAELAGISGLAVDASGDLYIAAGDRVRKISFGGASQGGGAPVIRAGDGVVNGAYFGGGIVSQSWATVQGANLSGVTATWDDAIVNGKLPTALAGVSVTIDGKPAYIYYVSPTQINLVVPDIGLGPVQVTVMNTGLMSNTAIALSMQYDAAFFPWPGGQPVATRADFSFVAKEGTFPTLPTTPAKPGEVVILWGTGFGPTSPPAPVGFVTPSDQTYSTSSPPEVMINLLPATVFGAALAPNFAGLYQVAIRVPESLPDGDWPIHVRIGGVLFAQPTMLAVRR